MLQDYAIPRKPVIITDAVSRNPCRLIELPSPTTNTVHSRVCVFRMGSAALWADLNYLAKVQISSFLFSRFLALSPDFVRCVEIAPHNSDNRNLKSLLSSC
jgi:hypothetical protein